jgi:hypothetical protein
MGGQKQTEGWSLAQGQPSVCRALLRRLHLGVMGFRPAGNTVIPLLFNFSSLLCRDFRGPHLRYLRDL